jgi:ubiquinone/menaquinone biosynthesis C-methylase UbiE
MAKKQIEAYYDKLSEVYDRDRAKGYFEFVNQFELNTILPHAKGNKVLEVGCGTGILLERVSKVAKRAVGIDLSNEMVKVAKARGLEAKKAFATKIPFKDNSFDIVFSFKTLSHVPNLELALSEMARVAKPGGLVVFELYNARSVGRLYKLLFPTKIFTKYYSTADAIKILPQNIEILEVKGVISFIPTRVIFDLPILQRLFAKLESLASRTFFKRFANYMIIVCRKK